MGEGRVGLVWEECPSAAEVELLGERAESGRSLTLPGPHLFTPPSLLHDFMVTWSPDSGGGQIRAGSASYPLDWQDQLTYLLSLPFLSENENIIEMSHRPDVRVQKIILIKHHNGA